MYMRGRNAFALLPATHANNFVASSAASKKSAALPENIALYGHVAIIRWGLKLKPTDASELSRRGYRARPQRFPYPQFRKRKARHGRRSGSLDGKRCLRLAPSSPDDALQDDQAR
jgi:hypothetical protein